jgi:hypothetical protein
MTWTFGTIEDLPEDSFKASGTHVRTCLAVMTKPEEKAAKSA